MEALCIFCGSSDTIQDKYLRAARSIGAATARRGLQLIYGGGSSGMMGAVANAALQNEGQVIGVIPTLFNTPQLAHTGLTRMEVVADMHQRKARMASLADAFIALPGGFGTLEELFEIVTWAQIGLHAKPIGLLNVDHYFDPLLAMIETARREGFIYKEHPALLAVAPEPERLLDQLAAYTPPHNLARWVDRDPSDPMASGAGRPDDGSPAVSG
jgi:uncharacterized protein (TIGR00730 family)